MTSHLVLLGVCCLGEVYMLLAWLFSVGSIVFVVIVGTVTGWLQGIV